MTDFRTHIQNAVKAAGSQKAFAEAIGISQQGVSFLLTDAKNCSTDVAIAIEKATNGEVTRSMLRPDIWPVSQPEQAA